MDLKARADLNFARVDANFKTVIFTEFHYRCYHFDITKHQGPTKLLLLLLLLNFSQIYQAILQKKLILMVLLFLELAAILDSQPC